MYDKVYDGVYDVSWVDRILEEYLGVRRHQDGTFVTTPEGCGGDGLKHLLMTVYDDPATAVPQVRT